MNETRDNDNKIVRSPIKRKHGRNKPKSVKDIMLEFGVSAEVASQTRDDAMVEFGLRQPPNPDHVAKIKAKAAARRKRKAAKLKKDWK